MAKTARPKRRFSGWVESDESILGMVAEHKGEMIEIPSPTGCVVIECELVNPPSSAGQKVYVFFDGEDLTDALKLLRDEAIHMRSKPMEPAR